MLRFLYVTDTHGRGSIPTARLDDFPRTLLGKFNYVNTLAGELDVAGIIHGGDWIESPDISNDFIRQMTLILKNSPVKWYGVLGNHDVYGQNPDTFTKTPLGIAEAAGTFTRLGREPFIFTDEEKKTKVGITGKDSYFDIDKKLGREDYCNSVITPGAVNIHVAHGFVDTHKWKDDIDCTSIDEIINCNADILLTGHVHQGYGIIKRGTKIFCNPNALARTTASIGDINNEVRVALITVDGPLYNIELLGLPTSVAKPANEVLDRERIEAEKIHKQQMSNFIGSIKSTNSLTGSATFDPYHVLNIVAKEDGLDDNIITMTRERLQEAEEEVKRGEGK